MNNNELEFIKDKNLFNDCLEDIFIESECNHESELIYLYFENKLNEDTEKLLRERLRNCSTCLRLYMDLEYSYLEKDTPKYREDKKNEETKIIDFETKKKSKNSNLKFFSGALVGSVAAVLIVMIIPKEQALIDNNQSSNFVSTSSNIDSNMLSNFDNIKSQKNLDKKVTELKSFVEKYPDFLPAILELGLTYKKNNSIDLSKKYFSIYIEKASKNKSDLEMEISNVKKYLEN